MAETSNLGKHLAQSTSSGPRATVGPSLLILPHIPPFCPSVTVAQAQASLSPWAGPAASSFPLAVLLPRPSFPNSDSVILGSCRDIRHSLAWFLHRACVHSGGLLCAARPCLGSLRAPGAKEQRTRSPWEDCPIRKAGCCLSSVPPPKVPSVWEQ